MRRGGLAAWVGVAVSIAGCGGTAASTPTASTAPTASGSPPAATITVARRPPPATRTVRTAAAAPGPPYAVGERTMTFVDRSRTVTYPGRRPAPRTLITVVRYPIAGPPSRVDVRDAPPDSAAGPFGLVVFGHGFAVTPADYFRLLRAWAQAGYVVAAPVFPLENAHAPGGPNESDLVNQPRDMSFVISQMLAASQPGGALAGLIAPGEIAVSGQSDGGETALAVAYDRQFLDRRVRAAVILSGAQIPGVNMLWWRPGGPPLLATQGTADHINPPNLTYQFYAVAHRPKYLLRLLGASHLPPYTSEQPQLTLVQRVSTAFLDLYLKHQSAAAAAMRRAGNRAGVAALTADP